MLQHSPGPWTLISDRRSPRRVMSADFHVLANVYMRNVKTNLVSPSYAGNAALIVYSPDMYAILQRAVAPQGNWLEAARRLLADMEKPL